VKVTEEMAEKAAMVLNKRLASGNGLHGVSRDMLEAALSAAPAVKVKPLPWEEDRGFWRAQTSLVACYSVWDCGDHWECSLIDGQFKTAKAAKSAAQADYERRVLSAIEGEGHE
jgi:hypothetical protein